VLVDATKVVGIKVVVLSSELVKTLVVVVVAMLFEAVDVIWVLVDKLGKDLVIVDDDGSKAFEEVELAVVSLSLIDVLSLVKGLPIPLLVTFTGLTVEVIILLEVEPTV
jgi:hypothetical protein